MTTLEMKNTKTKNIGRKIIEGVIATCQNPHTYKIDIDLKYFYNSFRIMQEDMKNIEQFIIESYNMGRNKDKIEQEVNRAAALLLTRKGVALLKEEDFKNDNVDIHKNAYNMSIFNIIPIIYKTSNPDINREIERYLSKFYPVVGSSLEMVLNVIGTKPVSYLKENGELTIYESLNYFINDLHN